jgi:hypothetical protein
VRSNKEADESIIQCAQQNEKRAKTKRVWPLSLLTLNTAKKLKEYLSVSNSARKEATKKADDYTGFFAGTRGGI